MNQTSNLNKPARCLQWIKIDTFFNTTPVLTRKKCNLIINVVPVYMKKGWKLSLWKSCLKQPSLEILQNANLNVLLVITECISHGCCGKRIDFSIDIITRAGYQSWDCHVGSHNHHFFYFVPILLKTLFLIEKMGKY